MPFSIHIYLHFLIALIIGYLAGRYFKRPWLCLTVALAGGFLIDLDHILEYFLIFGPHFNFYCFIQGREFLVSGKIYLLFHAWEWVALLALSVWLMRPKKRLKVILLTLAVAMAAHLLSDCLINHYPLQFYSLGYRASQNFSAAKLLSPEQYQENLELKADLGI
jgi:hypothetical protein